MKYTKYVKVLAIIALFIPVSAFAISQVGVNIATNGTVLNLTFPCANPDIGFAMHWAGGSVSTSNNDQCIMYADRSGDNLEAHQTGDGNYYYFWANNDSGTGGTNMGDSDYYALVYRTGGAWFSDFEYVGNKTVINTTTPTDKSVIATSTSNTFGATGEIIEDDINSGSKLTIDIINSVGQLQNCLDAICNVGYLSGAPDFLQAQSIKFHFEYPLVVKGPWSFSTTTIGLLPVGKYYVVTKILKGTFCLFGFCAYSSPVVATSTSFTISTTTKFDKIKDTLQAYQNSLIGTTTPFTACAIATLNLGDCLSDFVSYAFVPTPDALQYTADAFKQEVLIKPPFGYVTRLFTILSSTTTAPLPDASFPVIYGDDNTGAMRIATSSIFQPDEILTGGGALLDSMRDPVYGNNIQDVFQPIVSDIIWLMAWLIVIMDILGSHKHR